MFENYTPVNKERPFIGDSMKTIIRSRNDGDGWYCHISRPGRPGDTTDFYATEKEAIQAAKDLYPDAEVRS